VILQDGGNNLIIYVVVASVVGPVEVMTRYGISSSARFRSQTTRKRQRQPWWQIAIFSVNDIDGYDDIIVNYQRLDRSNSRQINGVI